MYHWRHHVRSLQIELAESVGMLLIAVHFFLLDDHVDLLLSAILATRLLHNVRVDGQRLQVFVALNTHIIGKPSIGKLANFLERLSGLMIWTGGLPPQYSQSHISLRSLLRA